MDLSHLGLTRWPFPIVPERGYCTFMADRKQMHSDVNDLLINLSRRDTSSIHLFWAWFGAGKTHTLFYLANKASEITDNSFGTIFHVIYSEFPKAARNFVDLYRSFVTELDIETIIESFLETSTSADSERIGNNIKKISLDLYTSLHVMATGMTNDQIIAMRWIRAEPLPITMFRNVGITQKITSVEEATRILVGLVYLLKESARVQGRSCRVLWLLDEFQRVERTGVKVLNEVNTGLHSTFNACPNHLSLFLSFSGNPKADLPGWFSPELRDRIGRTKVIILPPLLLDEALVFIKDVLEQFRPSDFDLKSPYFPFSEEACIAILKEVDKGGEIKPRAIMQAFSAVLEEADRKIEAKEMEIIDPQFAKKVLSERLVLSGNSED